jgi:uncharacterized protein (TIGR04255 family)
VPLKKPPIVEMWVEFKFELADPNSAIGPAEIQFLREFRQNFPKLRISTKNQLEFRQVSQDAWPEVTGQRTEVTRYTALNADGSRWLHVTRDQFVCNFLRLGDNYPGFAELSKEAVGKLSRYVEVCRPVKLQYAAIHYVDVIVLPASESGEIRLADYFTLGLDLPAESFGDQAAYLIRIGTVPRDGTGVMDVELQMGPPDFKKRLFRFRMDWHKWCPYDGEVDLEKIQKDLEKSHESVMRCFRAAFTEQTWKLFDPSD